MSMNPNKIITSEWKEDTEVRDRLKPCPQCNTQTGAMFRRRVEEASGDAHKEYKVICKTCKFNGPMHWSRALAVHGWNQEGID